MRCEYNLDFYWCSKNNDQFFCPYLQMSTEGTDESLEVEGILDDLNHSEDGFIDNCHLVGGKSIEDEDFPSYKTVVLGDSSMDRNLFDGMLNINSKFDRFKMA